MGYSFNSTGKEAMQEGGVLPNGWYGMRIDEVDYEANKAGTGHFIKLTWEVIDGPHAGRKYWARLNVDNPNPAAVEIAEKELTSICQATGIESFDDESQLQGAQALVKLGIKKDAEGREENRAYGYKPYMPPAAAAPAARPVAQRQSVAPRPRARANAPAERSYSTEDDLPF